MPLFENQAAPDFQAIDIWGNDISISSLKGQKVLLTFYRHIACPFTNLRFLELQEQRNYFKEMGLILISVYESSAENLQRYVRGESFYGRLIPNPTCELYTLYDIEQSSVKILFSMYKGAFSKAKEGQSRFKEKFCPEGRPNVLGGDFLIDEKGIIKYAYYNQYLGDHLSINEITCFISGGEINVNRIVC